MTDFAATLTAMRAAGPLVQNITNYVSMNVMANVLIAAGAAPAMVHAEEEAAEFAAIAGALTINIGTLSPAWVRAMEAAAKVAAEKGTPWVLDPVAAGATSYRREVSARLVALKPTVIRGNASEVIALAGAGAGGRGVDSTDTVAAAEAAARALAGQTGGVVAVSGPVDFVTDGTRAARIANGDAMMARVTATGCALSGVVAAFAAAVPDTFDATVGALTYYAVAGERAAVGAKGPGSFAVSFLDELENVDESALRAAAKIEALS